MRPDRIISRNCWPSWTAIDPVRWRSMLSARAAAATDGLESGLLIFPQSGHFTMATYRAIARAVVRKLSEIYHHDRAQRRTFGARPGQTGARARRIRSRHDRCRSRRSASRPSVRMTHGGDCRIELVTRALWAWLRLRSRSRHAFAIAAVRIAHRLDRLRSQLEPFGYRRAYGGQWPLPASPPCDLSNRGRRRDRPATTSAALPGPQLQSPERRQGPLVLSGNAGDRSMC